MQIAADDLDAAHNFDKMYVRQPGEVDGPIVEEGVEEEEEERTRTGRRPHSGPHESGDRRILGTTSTSGLRQ